MFKMFVMFFMCTTLVCDAAFPFRGHQNMHDDRSEVMFRTRWFILSGKGLLGILAVLIALAIVALATVSVMGGGTV
jgi:hypothetical protein